MNGKQKRAGAAGRARAENAEAWRELGLTLLRDGQPDEALAALERATSLNPRDAAAHLALGNALCKLKRPAEAVAKFPPVSDPDQHLTEAQLNPGVALRAGDQLAE